MLLVFPPFDGGSSGEGSRHANEDIKAENGSRYIEFIDPRRRKSARRRAFTSKNLLGISNPRPLKTTPASNEKKIPNKCYGGSRDGWSGVLLSLSLSRHSAKRKRYCGWLGNTVASSSVWRSSCPSASIG